MMTGAPYENLFSSPDDVIMTDFEKNLYGENLQNIYLQITELCI